MKQHMLKHKYIGEGVQHLPVQPCLSEVAWYPELQEHWYVPTMFTHLPFWQRLSLKEHSFTSGKESFVSFTCYSECRL